MTKSPTTSAAALLALLLAAGCTDDASSTTPDGVIGAAGGVLEKDGVRVEIPAGAMPQPMTLTLHVTSGDEPMIDVTPGVVFATPVHVRVDSSLWPAARAGYATELGEADSSHHVGFLEPDGSGVRFDTPGFSTLALRSTGEEASGGDIEPWSPGAKLGSYHDLPPQLPFIGKGGKLARASLESCLRNHEDRVAGGDSVSLTNPKQSTATSAVFSVWDFAARAPVDKTYACGPKACSDHLCATGRQASEQFLAQPLLDAALTQLAAEVDQFFGGAYALWTNGAYDSSMCAHKSERTRHAWGAAVDLDLCAVPCSAATKVENRSEELGFLAALTFKVFSELASSGDGKTFVFYEHDHVHAELTTPTGCPLPNFAGKDEITARVGDLDYATSLIFKRSNGFGNLVVNTTQEVSGGVRQLDLVLPDELANGTYAVNGGSGPDAVAIAFQLEDGGESWSTALAPAGAVSGSVEFHQDLPADKTYDSIVWGVFHGLLWNSAGANMSVSGTFKVEDAYFNL